MGSCTGITVNLQEICRPDLNICVMISEKTLSYSPRAFVNLRTFEIEQQNLSLRRFARSFSKYSFILMIFTVIFD